MMVNLQPFPVADLVGLAISRGLQSLPPTDANLRALVALTELYAAFDPDPRSGPPEIIAALRGAYAEAGRRVAAAAELPQTGDARRRALQLASEALANFALTVAPAEIPAMIAAVTTISEETARRMTESARGNRRKG